MLPEPIIVPDSIVSIDSIGPLQPDTVRFNFAETGLPVCYIVTRDSVEITSRSDYLYATMRLEQDGYVLFEDSLLSIRGRGHASWTDYPKHPYKLKLSSKSGLLGMKENRHFVLLANYSDKSLMRTAIGFKIGELLECDWTPQSRFVELVLNGEYQGCYQLTESVRAGKDRIQVDGSGFIVEYVYPDRIDREPFYFETMRQLYFGFKYPDEDDQTEMTVGYAKAVIDTLERVLYEPQREHEFVDYIDVESWAKWYYQQNMLMLEEYNLYLVKYDDTVNSRLRMGPLWDFDWCLGVGFYDGEERPNPNHHLVSTHYFRKLSSDSLFMAEVARVHRRYGQRVRDGVMACFYDLQRRLQRSQKLNFERWPILDERVSIGGYPLGSWEREVECDKQFFIAHYDFIDNCFK